MSYTPPPAPRDLEAQRARFPVAAIEELVHTFYGQVRGDAVLGPIFARRIDAWPPHLARMVAFWRSVLRSEPAFTASLRGNPRALHARIEELELAHFDRWLGLFDETAERVWAADPAPAAEVRRRARRIARTLAGDVQARAGSAQP